MSASALSQVCFTPAKSILFSPTNSKQIKDLTIQNGSEHIVIFKMKHTRPGMYKMRPVFGCIQPGTTLIVNLIFKGLKPSMKCPTRDRFTCVLAIAPSTISNTQKMWKNPKFMETLASNEMSKKSIAIPYEGVNDREALPKSEEDVSLKEKKGKVKKGAAAVDKDDEDEKLAAEKAMTDKLAAAEKDKEKAVAAALAAAQANAPKQKGAIVVMFRERPPESKSDDEDEDDEDGKVEAAAAKPSATKVAAKTPAKPAPKKK